MTSHLPSAVSIKFRAQIRLMLLSVIIGSLAAVLSGCTTFSSNNDIEQNQSQAKQAYKTASTHLYLAPKFRQPLAKMDSVLLHL